MSTYGRKALKYWNYQYSEENAKRLNRTPIEIQSEILEKWYPIGMKCFKYDRFYKKYNTSHLYEIVGYNSIGCGTILQLDLIKYLVINEKVIKENVTIHATFFKPTDEWVKQNNRDEKLNEILG